MKNDVDITVYDTLNASISTTTKVILAKLVCTSQDLLTIEASKVNTQSGTSDCGVFACAYVASLAHGQDPSIIVYDQQKMRDHLIMCIEKEEISLFPVARAKRKSSKLKTIDIHCTCRCPYTGEKNVQCNTCRKWYHVSCLQNMQGSDNMKEKWFCEACNDCEDLL